jgi:hypothetical protein
VNTNAWTRSKAVCLTLAVLHHGLSNLTSAESAKPASVRTVIETADTFGRWWMGREGESNEG